MSYYQRPKNPAKVDTGVRMPSSGVVVFHHFSRTAAVVMSLGQAVLGLCCLGVQVGGIFLDVISTHLGATGIWAGVFIIFAGISGLVAARYRVPGAICSYMVLSIIAAIAAPAIVVTSTVSIMELEYNCNGDSSCTVDTIFPKKVIDIVLIILAVIEYCLASCCVITCCWTMYCDPAGYQFESFDTLKRKKKAAAANQGQNDYEMGNAYQTEDVFEAIEEEEEPDDESDKVSQHTEKEDIEEEEEEQIEEVHDRDPDIEEDEDGGIGNPAFDSHMSEQNHIDAA